MPSYLGQNFLTDISMQDHIIQTAERLYADRDCDTIIEIGPGKWALTIQLQHKAKHFFCVEKDPLMRKALLQQGIADDKIILQDVLERDFFARAQQHDIDPSKVCIVWNLPYYITSPIIRKFFADGHPQVPCGVIMIQKEVGDKIKSDAGKKSYLRWLLNYAYHVDYTITVPPTSFDPAPKVHSCVLGITRKDRTRDVDFDTQVQALELFSPYSRKTLGKICKMHDIDPTPLGDIAQKRLEELGEKDWLTLIGVVRQSAKQ